jgi:hypothetical protein
MALLVELPELWWANQEFSSADIIPPCSYIIIAIIIINVVNQSHS